MSVRISTHLQLLIRNQFANCCACCRTAEELAVSIFEFEHIIPRSADGKTDIENLCLACPTCNRFKANRIRVADPVTLQEVALFHPQRDSWRDHFVWNDDATEITPLTAVGRATIAALRMNRAQLIRVRRMWVALGEHPRNPE